MSKAVMIFSFCSHLTTACCGRHHLKDAFAHVQKVNTPLVLLAFWYLYRRDRTHAFVLILGWLGIIILFPQKSNIPIILVPNCCRFWGLDPTHTGKCKCKNKGVRQITPAFPSPRSLWDFATRAVSVSNCPLICSGASHVEMSHHYH